MTRVAASASHLAHLLLTPEAKSIARDALDDRIRRATGQQLWNAVLDEIWDDAVTAVLTHLGIQVPE